MIKALVVAGNGRNAVHLPADGAAAPYAERTVADGITADNVMKDVITLSSVDLMRAKSEALHGLECALRTESVKPIP